MGGQGGRWGAALRSGERGKDGDDEKLHVAGEAFSEMAIMILASSCKEVFAVVMCQSKEYDMMHTASWHRCTG